MGTGDDVAIARAQEGDRDAIRFLYVRYADNVHGYVRSIVRDPHDAEDVTQQVFTKLIGAIAKYEPREVPFLAWILRVARNVALDHTRRQHPIPHAELRAADVTDDFSGRERSDALRDALAELPLDQREVLILRHVIGLSPGEIATRLGKTEASIHGLHHRGRGTLKAALTARDAVPTTA